MAKNIKAIVRLLIKGGAASPASVGSVLGPHGIKTMDFCKDFNAQTGDRKGENVPVVMNIYQDRTFDFITKTPPTTDLIKKAVKLSKGSSNPRKDKVGSITQVQVEEIAKIKMPDLNAADIEAAKKIIAGSARSMGVDVI